MTYSVVIADDHMLVRHSIRRILENAAEFEVVGEADNGVSAVTLVKSLRPHLVVLDIAMPQATGVEVIEEVRRWSPETKIAVITGMNSNSMLQHVYESGVDGVFLKTGDASGWAGDFLAICEGERRISDSVRKLVNDRAGKDALTGRERQILFGIARGETNAVIAERLGISANTVDKHRTSIMRKLGVHSAAALLARALRDGLLEGANQN
ncbi:response regulator [Hyphococcus luteus]|uniref:response regulator n=1 Tax=Hyphococcus luteus TaxID=2058213 RepID=UPI0013FD8D8E|nr:response regulator transcription factor [Marinicaulis flavus]